MSGSRMGTPGKKVRLQAAQRFEEGASPVQP